MQFPRSLALFAGIVGTLQIADMLLRLIRDGSLVMTAPGAGPLLLAGAFVLLREIRAEAYRVGTQELRREKRAISARR